jgi:hypothetical protein
MQGAGAHEDQIGLLPDTALGGEDGPGRVQLRADAHITGDDLARLMSSIGAAITGPTRHRPVTVWTGVEFDHVDDLDLWLGLRLPAAGILTADREITDTGHPTSITRAGAPALVTDGGFAYRTKRSLADAAGFETGVVAWGQDAADLAVRYAHTVAEWGRYRAEAAAVRGCRSYRSERRSSPTRGIGSWTRTTPASSCPGLLRRARCRADSTTPRRPARGRTTITREFHREHTDHRHVHRQH